MISRKHLALVRTVWVLLHGLHPAHDLGYATSKLSRIVLCELRPIDGFPMIPDLVFYHLMIMLTFATEL